jgi:molybdopterin-dependent oxidoreductase alpha subunit
MANRDDKPDYLSPDEVESGIEVGKPAGTAGGVTAVVSALKISVEQMGVVRSASTLLDVNQTKGFDCPGCAWPDPDDRRSLVEFCENGAKAVAEEATSRRVTPDFFARHSVADLAAESDFWLSQQGRITHPMYLPPGGTHYEAISWDEAFAKIGHKLKSLATPNDAVFYTSGRTSNEAAFLYQLFVRMLGTNNMPDCSDLCHESSGYALTQTVGSGKGSVSLKDFDHADCIIVIGQNPGTNHPRMLTTLQQAARRGCRIISINPLEETGIKRFKHPQEVAGVIGRGTRIASHHVPVKINGDVALLKGIQKAILENHPESIDRAFIEAYTEGFDDYRRDIEKETWEAIEGGSGISESGIREIAGVIVGSKSLICCWAMGLTQHRNAVANIQEIVNLLLLGGHFGRPGTGACPVRGHSNVQGDRTMGIWERPTREFLDRIAAEFNFTPPYEHGYDTVETIEAMNAGKIKVFFAMGGNFLSATPDTAYTASGLKRCELTVQVSTKLNRSHIITGGEALILPCLGRTERDLQDGGLQFVTVENSMGVVHSSEGHLSPASPDLLSEPAIVAGLAKATLDVDWGDYIANYDRIRDRIQNAIPGFDDFNARVRNPGGFVLPHAVRDKREFKTPSGRARFTVHAIPRLDVGPGQFVMATIRTHDQYNTTIYGVNDRYRGIHHGRRVVLMNQDDIRDQGLADGDIVDITSHWRGKERHARNFRIVTYDIPRGCVASYFPETNILVPVDNFADGSQTPVSKSIVVSFSKARA